MVRQMKSVVGASRIVPNTLVLVYDSASRILPNTLVLVYDFFSGISQSLTLDCGLIRNNLDKDQILFG